jgi:competence protein ComEA
VRRPGVVRLPAGARLEDAVREAGGPTRHADLTAVNLARTAADGEQVFIPRPGETPPAAAAPPGTVAGGGPATPGAPVDLNTADETALDALPGVGPVIAGRIVAWRQQHGRFTSVDELTEVSGIGDATLERLRPLVRT